MVALWPGGYTLFDDNRLPPGVFKDTNHDPAQEQKGLVSGEHFQLKFH